MRNISRKSIIKKIMNGRMNRKNQSEFKIKKSKKKK